jgi:hypothetical protein
MMRKKTPKAQSDEARLFYILVVEMGIAPSEVRDLTLLQVESLLYWHKKAQEESR